VEKAEQRVKGCTYRHWAFSERVRGAWPCTKVEGVVTTVAGETTEVPPPGIPTSLLFIPHLLKYPVVGQLVRMRPVEKVPAEPGALPVRRES
jgi:hypothetical protein